MSANNEKVRMKIRLTEEEKAKLEHDAALCGLPQAEYVRQVCLDRQPRPKPPAEFWELMDALYALHDALEKLTICCPEFVSDCRKVERIVLRLQEVQMGPPQSPAALWGEEHPRNDELSPLAVEAVNGA